jgi:hypothetical protein
MTNEQFDALMNAIDVAIEAKMAITLNWSEPEDYHNRAITAEEAARKLLVTDSPTEDQPQ